MKKIFTLSAILFFAINVFAQNVGIGTPTPDASAQLDISTNKKGVLIPRMTKADRNLIASPANGLLVFQSGPDSVGFYYYNSSSWVWLQNSTGAGSGLSTTGNAGTDTSVNFIGTTDNVSLVFKINNKRYGLLDANYNNITLGTAAYSKPSNYTTGANVAIGTDALLDDTTGSFNTAIGYSSMINTKSSGNQNTAVGSFSLKNNLGSQNTALGSGAMEFHYSGNYNTAVGSYAYGNKLNGTGNTAIGYFSMYPNISRDIYGNYNTAVGMFSLSESKGSGAVAIGYKAAYSDTAAEGIVAIGRAALYNNNNKGNNLAIGDSSLFNNSLTAIFSNQGIKNTAVGDHSLFGNATGSYNTAMGSFALTSNTKGSSNTAMGIDALRNNLTGNNNTGLGENALQLNINGHRNTAIGSTTMQYRTTGDDNVAIGWGALLLDDDGRQNTAIGNGALLNQTSGIENVAVGFSAGMGNQTGNFNVFIGGHSGAFSNNASNRLYISNSANDDSTTSLIYGNFESDSLLLNAKTVVKNNAVVRGYTKLGGYGADVPSIKMKKINVTNGGVGIQTGYDHGLTQSKILSVSVLINATSGNDIAPRSTYGGFEYDYFVGATKIFIRNISGNDSSIAGRPIKILITYEE